MMCGRCGPPRWQTFGALCSLLACNYLLGIEEPTKDDEASRAGSGSDPCQSTEERCIDRTLWGCSGGALQLLRSCSAGCLADSCAVTIGPSCSPQEWQACHGNVTGSWRVRGICGEEAWPERRSEEWLTGVRTCRSRILRVARLAVGELEISEEYAVTGYVTLAVNATVEVTGACEAVSGNPSLDNCEDLKGVAGSDQVIIESCRPSGTRCLCTIRTLANQPWQERDIAKQLAAGQFCVDEATAAVQLEGEAGLMQLILVR